MFTWKQYKQNRIDAVNSRNNTNAWTKAHSVKPAISFIGWFKSVIRCTFAGKPKYEVLKSEEINFDF